MLDLFAAIIVCSAGAAGVLLTALTLPGAWFALLVAGACQWWRNDLFSWWTLGAALAMAAAGEVLELVASARGARRAGASRPGAWGAIIGAFVGAILGAPVLFPLGAIAGGVLGAATGALVGELAVARRSVETAVRSAGGAAKGRLAATFIKLGASIAVGLTLSVAAFVP